MEKNLGINKKPVKFSAMFDVLKPISSVGLNVVSQSFAATSKEHAKLRMPNASGLETHSMARIPMSGFSRDRVRGTSDIIKERYCAATDYELVG